MDSCKLLELFINSPLSIIYNIIIVIITSLAIAWGKNWFSYKKYLNKEKTNRAIQYMEDAYKFIAFEVNQNELKGEKVKKLNEVLALIQLYGNDEIIGCALRLQQQLGIPRNEVKLDEILDELRSNLRKILSIEPVEDERFRGKIFWVFPTIKNNR
jgi:hypothetical protein